VKIFRRNVLKGKKVENPDINPYAEMNGFREYAGNPK
jgi:hypothetical protein